MGQDGLSPHAEEGLSPHAAHDDPETRDRNRHSPWQTARLQIASTVTHATGWTIDWPWSGSVRKIIYVDFFIYVVLLVVFCCITLLPTTNTSFDAYKLVQSVQSTLLEEFRPEPEISFFDINELAGLRRWLEGQFMAVFFGYNPNTPPNDDVWVDMTPLPTYIPGFYLASTTVLGPIRLRQLRVRSDSCEVDERWKPLVDTCFAAYSTGGARVYEGDEFQRMWYPYPNATVVEDKINDSLVTEDRLQPTAAQVLARNITLEGFQFRENTDAGVYRGRLANIYWGSGFVVDIPEHDEEQAREVLRMLSVTNWLDAQTRALFLEFSLYLPPSNLMLAARLIMEVHETGTVWTDVSLEPINLGIFRLHSKPEMSLLVIGLGLVFLAMVWDIRSTWTMRQYQSRQTGSAYVWVIVGILLYLAIAAAAALHVYNMQQTTRLEFEFGKYFPTHRLGYMVTVERGIWAMASFVIWFRLLKFTSQLPVLGILGRTIGRALPQVAAFFLISCVIFLAFAQCFFMAYYASVPGYQSYQASLMSVLRFTVLDFDYAALSAENRILTPFLFTLLLLIVFFVWVNVMVAIISEVYQQECDKSLNVTWDEDYPSMHPDVPQPQNDLAAMRMHYPVQSTPNEGPLQPVQLTPDRFFRMRFEKLEHFENLVTIDMYAHFCAAAANKAHSSGRLNPSGGSLDSHGRPDSVMPPGGVPPSPFQGTQRKGPDPVNWEVDDAETFTPWPKRRRENGSADVAAATAAGYDAGAGYMGNMLQQHRGVYARLGTFSRIIRKGAQGARADGGLTQLSDLRSVQERSLDSDPGVMGRGGRTRPMELQALYFDREYHNETTAKLWWDDHKSFFDTREQLIQYLIVSGGKTIKKAAGKLRKTVSNVGMGRLSGPRLSRTRQQWSNARRSAIAALRGNRHQSPPPAVYAATSAAAADGSVGISSPPWIPPQEGYAMAAASAAPAPPGAVAAPGAASPTVAAPIDAAEDAITGTYAGARMNVVLLQGDQVMPGQTSGAIVSDENASCHAPSHPAQPLV